MAKWLTLEMAKAFDAECLSHLPRLIVALGPTRMQFRCVGGEDLQNALGRACQITFWVPASVPFNGKVEEVEIRVALTLSSGNDGDTAPDSIALWPEDDPLRCVVSGLFNPVSWRESISDAFDKLSATRLPKLRT